MELRLDGEVSVVVGAARGIGRAMAEIFAAAGSRTMLLDRHPDVTLVAARIREQTGLLTTAYLADVTSPDLIQQTADSIYRDHGHVDHLLFAAGIGSGQFGMPFWNVDPARWEPVLKVNLIGAMHVARAFAPRMAERKQGSLIFLSSVAGQNGSPTDPPYSASKAGLINFAQCAARDLAPLGVRVNTICPGMVDTPLNRSVYEAWAAQQPEDLRKTWEEWSAEKIARLVPLNRWQQPEDIAAMALFLASRYGQNITGQTINVDGGYVMHW